MSEDYLLQQPNTSLRANHCNRCSTTQANKVAALKSSLDALEAHLEKMKNVEATLQADMNEAVTTLTTQLGPMKSKYYNEASQEAASFETAIKIVSFLTFCRVFVALLNRAHFDLSPSRNKRRRPLSKQLLWSSTPSMIALDLLVMWLMVSRNLVRASPAWLHLPRTSLLMFNSWPPHHKQ
jgi:hypothetical protein